MGFFDALGDMVKDSVSSSLGLSDTNENTVHEYTYDGSKDLKYDDDYSSVFKNVAKCLHSKNRMDNYISEIVFSSNWLYWCAEVVDVPKDAETAKHFVLWRLGYRDKYGNFKYLRVRITSHNACQLQWDGSVLFVGYEAKVGGDHVKEKIWGRKVENSLKSFLGIRFGEDYRKYANPSSTFEDFDGNEDYKWVEAGRGFVCYEFIPFYVMFNRRDGKVCGLLVGVNIKKENVIKGIEECLGIKFCADGDKYSFDGKSEDFCISISTDDDVVMLFVLADKYSLKKRAPHKDLKIKRLTSFLGAEFGGDCRKYACDQAHREDWRPGIQSVSASLNKFMDFDSKILYSKYSNRVVGVISTIGAHSSAVGTMVRADERFMDRVKAILEEKYERPCEWVKNEDSDESGEAISSKREIVFREDEEDVTSKILAKIALYEKDDKIFLRAINMEEFENAINPGLQRQSAFDAL